MIFDTKILAAIAFICLCFAAIFFAKSRTAVVSTLIIAHLNLILFFSLTITNYNSFKEIVLMLIAYLMIVLFLITNYDQIKQTSHKALQIKLSQFIKIFSTCIFFIIFSCLLYLTNNAFYSMKSARNTQEIRLESTLEEANKNQSLSALEQKKIYLQTKLNENSLLKRSCDLILIIIAASTIGLALQQKKIFKL